MSGINPDLRRCTAKGRGSVSQLSALSSQLPRLRRAFSLIEVVAAVGIFAIGMVGVLALFAPVTKSVVTITDAENAARVADAVRSRLQALAGKDFSAAAALLEDATTVRKNDADPAYNPNDGTKHPTVLFGKLNGDVGIYDPATGRKNWRDSNDTLVNDTDKFFEIDLIRNDTLSPKANDATATMLAYNLRVRWPAFVLTSASTAVQNGQSTGGTVTSDQSKKQMLFFTGFITR